MRTGRKAHFDNAEGDVTRGVTAWKKGVETGRYGASVKKPQDVDGQDVREKRFSAFSEWAFKVRPVAHHQP